MAIVTKVAQKNIVANKTFETTKLTNSPTLGRSLKRFGDRMVQRTSIARRTTIHGDYISKTKFGWKGDPHQFVACPNPNLLFVLYENVVKSVEEDGVDPKEFFVGWS
jgi:hypothetical protein